LVKIADTLWLGFDRAANDHGTAHAQILQHASQRFTQLGSRHSDQHRRGSRGIQQRAEKVENRALPPLCAELSGRNDVQKSRMILWSKEKRETVVPERTH